MKVTTAYMTRRYKPLSSQKVRFVLSEALSLWSQWVGCSVQDDFFIHVCFETPEKTKELNLQFRGKDYVPNILTFNYDDPHYSGADLIICSQVVSEQALQWSKSLESHQVHLLLHGFLHAKGYDHQEEEEAQEMEGLEIKLMNKLGFSNPYEGVDLGSAIDEDLI